MDVQIDKSGRNNWAPSGELFVSVRGDERRNLANHTVCDQDIEFIVHPVAG